MTITENILILHGYTQDIFWNLVQWAIMRLFFCAGHCERIQDIELFYQNVREEDYQLPNVGEKRENQDPGIDL